MLYPGGPKKTTFSTTNDDCFFGHPVHFFMIRQQNAKSCDNKLSLRSNPSRLVIVRGEQ